MPEVTADLIDRLIAARRRRADALSQHVDWWESAAALVDEVISKTAGALGDATLPSETRAEMSQARVEELAPLSGQALAALREAQTRLQRSTINIGVSGRAQMGKSTLLQSLSGLPDDVVPSGQGVPMTAVRSRIFHTTGEPNATITFHSEDSFLTEVVGPFYEALSGVARPRDLAQFAADVAEPVGPAREKERLMRERLEQTRTALPSYRHLLTGRTESRPLVDLRPLVAYPSSNDAGAARPYLAVRDIRIECSFPRADIGKIGLLDLPGLGEINAGAEVRHVQNVRDEVDAVLFVKRTVVGGIHFSDQDNEGLALLERACAPVEPKDFVLFVINGSQQDDPTHKSLMVEELAGKFATYARLSTDAQSPDDVDRDVLDPLLEHLGRSLERTDQLVLDAALAVAERARAGLVAALGVLNFSLRMPSSPQQELRKATHDLQRQLAVALDQVIQGYRSSVRDEHEDERFVAAVDEARNKTREWIASGFGMGRETWEAKALEEMTVDLGPGKVATHWLNAVRVEISNRFSMLDAYFDDESRRAWAGVAEALRTALGPRLVPMGDGRAALISLKETLLSAERPASVLAGAVADLLDLRLDYRAQLHPRVRREADLLTPTYVDEETGVTRERVSADRNAAGATHLFQQISQLAEAATHGTRQALVAEAVVPAKVLFAAVEQFDDSFMRSATALDELFDLTETFMHDIWPGRFTERAVSVLRLREVGRAKTQLLEHLTEKAVVRV